MQDPYGGWGDSWWRSCLTQYLKFQEEQDMTRLLYFTWTQEMRREGVYIVVVKKIWMEGRSMRFNKQSKRIMNLDLILDFGELWCIKCRNWWEWGVSKILFFRSYRNSLQSQIQKNHILLNSDRNCLVLMLKLKPRMSSFWEN